MFQHLSLNSTDTCHSSSLSTPACFCCLPWVCRNESNWVFCPCSCLITEGPTPLLPSLILVGTHNPFCFHTPTASISWNPPTGTHGPWSAKSPEDTISPPDSPFTLSFNWTLTVPRGPCSSSMQLSPAIPVSILTLLQSILCIAIRRMLLNQGQLTSLLCSKSCNGPQFPSERKSKTWQGPTRPHATCQNSRCFSDFILPPLFFAYLASPTLASLLSFRYIGHAVSMVGVFPSTFNVLLSTSTWPALSPPSHFLHKYYLLHELYPDHSI